jgi:hypothetical protein
MPLILLRWIHNPEICDGGNGKALAAVTQSYVFKYHVKKVENWAILGIFQRRFSPMSSHLLPAGGVHFGNAPGHQPIL